MLAALRFARGHATRAVRGRAGRAPRRARAGVSRFAYNCINILDIALRSQLLAPYRRR